MTQKPPKLLFLRKIRQCIKEDRYEAEFSNLGVKNIPIYPDYPSKYGRLLCGGIWCILQLDYEFIEEDKKNTTPIRCVN